MITALVTCSCHPLSVFHIWALEVYVISPNLQTHPRFPSEPRTHIFSCSLGIFSGNEYVKYKLFICAPLFPFLSTVLYVHHFLPPFLKNLPSHWSYGSPSPSCDSANLQHLTEPPQEPPHCSPCPHSCFLPHMAPEAML